MLARTASRDIQPSDSTAPEASMVRSLGGLSLSMLLASLASSIANVALPTLAAAFHASFQEVQWVVLAYLLAVTATTVGVGRLGDVVGRRRLMLSGLWLFTIASALCAVATTLPLLIGARVVQGLAAAIMMALTLAFVSEAVPREKSGSAMGLLASTSAMGTALGPSLGGALIAAFGWPSIFMVNVPLGLMALRLAFQSLPMDRNATVSAGFERQALAPPVGVLLLRDAWLRARLAMSGLVTTVVMATLVVGPFYLSGALGLDAAGVGLVMSMGPVVAALFGLPAGRLVDRFGARRVTMAGLMGMAAGTSLLALLPTGFGVAGYTLPLTVITAGYAFFQAANNTAVMARANEHQRGLMSGLLHLSRNLGLIAGASLMGAVFAFTSGGRVEAASPSEAIAIGMRATFAVGAILVFAAMGAAMTGSPAVRKPATAPVGETIP